jgi:amino acid transporter
MLNWNWKTLVNIVIQLFIYSLTFAGAYLFFFVDPSEIPKWLPRALGVLTIGFGGILVLGYFERREARAVKMLELEKQKADAFSHLCNNAVSWMFKNPIK